jgi:hypothetical protein
MGSKAMAAFALLLALLVAVMAIPFTPCSVLQVGLTQNGTEVITYGVVCALRLFVPMLQLWLRACARWPAASLVDVCPSLSFLRIFVLGP